MNSNNEKSNLKSFVIVAAFLAIFGSLLYSSNNVETLDNSASKPNYKQVQANVQEESDEEAAAKASPFKKLAEATTDTQSPAVLQAATDDGGTVVSGTNGEGEPTGGSGDSMASGTGPQSSPSVPSTGSTAITMALILSSAALAFGFFVMSKNPRKLALARFEKKITKKL